MTTVTAAPGKDEVRALLDNLPDDVSIEDIMEALYVRLRILKGMDDVEAGNLFTSEEARERMKSWLE